MLYGRVAECAALERLLAEARASHSGVLVMRGEPGLGKSALLEEAAQRAVGFRVLRAVGIESESELAFAALHQLLRPVFALIDRLPDPQAAPLRGAFGLSDEGTHNRFVLSVAVLSLLSEASEPGPLLCVVDDAHWLDPPSADALRFCSRRLGAEGIVMVFAAGEDGPPSFDAPDLPELRLAGLDAESAGRLLAERAGSTVEAGVLERLAAETEGNPLALIELPRVLSAAQLAGRGPLGGSGPRHAGSGGSCRLRPDGRGRCRVPPSARAFGDLRRGRPSRAAGGPSGARRGLGRCGTCRPARLAPGGGDGRARRWGRRRARAVGRAGRAPRRPRGGDGGAG